MQNLQKHKIKELTEYFKQEEAKKKTIYKTTSLGNYQASIFNCKVTSSGKKNKRLRISIPTKVVYSLGLGKDSKITVIILKQTRV